MRPPIPGIERALSLRDIEDTDALVAASAPARTAAIIGGGFIGLELAENLTRRGIAVTVVEAADQVMTPLDPEMVAPVQDHLRASGVTLRLGTSVTAIGPDTVTLSSGEQVGADLVVAAVGVRPDTRLAADAGLATGRLGGILVDSRFRTSDPRILAVGDAVEKRDALDGEQVLVPLANTANRQGRMAADVMAGLTAHDRPVLGTAIVGVFGLQVATTGWSEKRLVAAGRPHRVVHTHPASHATYYPGAEGMSLKLLVDRDTDAILGAQGVGRDGVDKRIDVIATAMTGGLTASALADLELAYAPQFASAKDPVNMLGYIADNLRSGVARSIQWHELADAVAAGAVLVDVRTQAEHEAGAHPGLPAPPRRRAAPAPRRGPRRPGRRALRGRPTRPHRGPGPHPCRARRAQPRRWLPHMAGRHEHARAGPDALSRGRNPRAVRPGRGRASPSARHPSPRPRGLVRHSRRPVAMTANPARSSALETAASWVTMSLQSRPSSIILTMPPIWPRARLRRRMTDCISSRSSSTAFSWGRRGDVP